MVAFAELGRLERDRAGLAATKGALRERLTQQRRALVDLRERLEAERPRAIARVRRERARHERLREQLTARLIAEAESAHDQRLALVRAELEAKRLRLAALEVTEPVVKPSRRWLEWSVPVAATALVAFLGFTLFDEEQAVAHTAPVEQWMAPIEAPASETEAEPILEVEVEEPVSEVEAEPTAEPVAPGPSKKPTTTSKKPTTTKKPTTSKPEPTLVIKKNSKPIDLSNFGADPLG